MGSFYFERYTFTHIEGSFYSLVFPLDDEFTDARRLCALRRMQHNPMHGWSIQSLAHHLCKKSYRGFMRKPHDADVLRQSFFISADNLASEFLGTDIKDLILVIERHTSRRR